MTRASYSGGELAAIKDCYLFVPNYGRISFYSLPELGDSKSASYSDEPIIGRAFPIKTYSHSENRTISLQLNLFIRKKEDAYTNLRIKRAIESTLYPRDETVGANAPFIPPPVCRLRCGYLLSDGELCIVCKSCSSKSPTDVPWDEDTLCPYKLTLDTTWDTVYKNNDLPGQGRIIREGR